MLDLTCKFTIFLIILLSHSNYIISDGPGTNVLSLEQTSTKHIVIVTLESAPFMIKRNKSDGNQEWFGFCMDFFNEVVKYLPYNLTYEIYEVSDRKYGTKSREHTWNGIVGELQSGRAHLALGPMAVMAERELVIDFSVPFYDLVGIQILLKKPEVPQDWFKFLTVLDGEVWMSITIAYFVTSLVIFLFDRLSPYSYKNRKDLTSSDRSNLDFDLKDSFWFCITSLTPQGGGEAPQNLSGRIVAGAWWLFCFIIIASYTANLAAFLTVSRLDLPIESLDDLSKQYRIKYAPADGSAEKLYFERMAYIEEIFYKIWKDMSLNDSLSEEERSKFAVWDYPISDKYTKIWSQIKQVGLPPDSATGIQRVRESTLDEGFALLADANTIRYAVMTDCSLKAVGDEFSRKPVALGLRKGDDELKNHVNQAILKLINQRFMETLREKWWTNNPDRAICVEDDKSDGLSVRNICGVFIIIFAGVGLSFVAWVVERFILDTKIEISRSQINA